MLRLSALTLAGVGAGGCAALFRSPEEYAGVPLARVHASADRVTGVLVGLRPFRPRGIRLEAEKLDERTVIHNYGHGGAGVSLSWGTAYLAAEEALHVEERRAAVVGAGAVGLATARQLQRRGFEVTIYTRATWPDESVCSGVAPARFTPSYSIIEPEHRTPGFDAFYERAAALSYREWTALVGTGRGVEWTYRYSVRDEAPQVADGREPGGLGAEERVVLGPGEHPFPTPWAVRGVTLTIDTPVFLDATLRDFHLWGGRLVRRTFADPRSLAELDEPLIVNCAGLGAREVAGDRSVVPLRGQLTTLLPQAEVDYIVTGGGFSLVPRAGGLLLGGAPNREGDWSLEVDEPASRAVVERAEELFREMRSLPRLVAGRPGAPAGRTPPAGPGSDPARFPADELTTALAF